MTTEYVKATYVVYEDGFPAMLFRTLKEAADYYGIPVRSAYEYCKPKRAAAAKGGKSRCIVKVPDKQIESEDMATKRIIGSVLAMHYAGKSVSEIADALFLRAKDVRSIIVESWERDSSEKALEDGDCYDD